VIGLLRATLVALAPLVLAACAQAPRPLYAWESFPRQQYETLLAQDPNPAKQIQALEAHAEKARGANGALPPGFRAHLGFLHLQAGDKDAARKAWQAEKLAFPESAVYIDSLLKRLEGPAAAKTTSSENPA
jgi:hypothetical protein